MDEKNRPFSAFLSFSENMRCNHVPHINSSHLRIWAFRSNGSEKYPPVYSYGWKWLTEKKTWCSNLKYLSPKFQQVQSCLLCFNPWISTEDYIILNTNCDLCAICANSLVPYYHSIIKAMWNPTCTLLPCGSEESSFNAFRCLKTTATPKGLVPWSGWYTFVCKNLKSNMFILNVLKHVFMMNDWSLEWNPHDFSMIGNHW